MEPFDANSTAAGAIEAPTPLHFSFNLAQKPDEGEDADPLLVIAGDGRRGVLAVFDGMGGAGAARYQVDGRSRTGAYIASRLAAEVVGGFVDTQDLLRGDHPEPAILASRLQRALMDAFRAAIARLDHGGGPRLAGTMVRRLPTTVAALAFAVDNAGRRTYTALWAGDSRVYLLGPAGLQQLSHDDIRSAGDALQNLLEDSPISNCVDADSDFVIHAAAGSCDEPCLFIVATDGSFNYGLSPAHFEHALLRSLMESTGPDAWRDALMTRQVQVAGDDLSLALVAHGWSTLADIQHALSPRARHLEEVFIAPLDLIDRRVGELADERRTALTRRDELRVRLWEQYRADYERFRTSGADERP